MMLVWTGAGILVIPIALLGVCLGVIIAGAFGADAHAAIGAGLGAILAAIGIWFLGRGLNNGNRDRLLLDPATREHVVLRHRHTVFWLNMEWWSVPLLLAGALLMFT